MLLSFSVVAAVVVERHSSPIHTEEEDAVTHRKPYKVPNINLLTNTRHSFRTSSSSLSPPACLVVPLSKSSAGMKSSNSQAQFDGGVAEQSK